MRPRTDVLEPQCEHFALVYDGVDDLARRLAPHLRRAAGEDAAVLVCLDDTAAARIRSDFGSLSDSFVFMPTTNRYQTPGVAMSALDSFVDDAMASGASSVWSIGSIPLDRGGGHSGWMRYEEAVASVFAHRPLRALCAYDAAITPVELWPSIRHTHQPVDGDRSAVGADETLVSYNLCPPRAPDLVLADAPAQAVRDGIDTLFGGSPPSERLADFRLVASELITNAFIHGASPRGIRVWKDGSSCVLQVYDAGTSPIDVYADLKPCAGGPNGGFGLWTVGQLSDAVHIAHDDLGSTVTALMRPAGGH